MSFKCVTLSHAVAAAERQTVGRHNRMRRGFLTLLACCAVAACSPLETAPTPPQTRDRVAELEAFDPTSPDARPNPSIDSSTLGCYSVVLDPPFGNLSPPKTIRLTGEEAGTFGFHQLYVVESEGKRSTFWSWRPYTAEEVRVTLGNGFGGWSLTLRQVPNGFKGQAVWMNDTLERHEALAEVRRIRCP